MTSQATLEQKAPSIIYDEYHHYLPRANDALRRSIRSVAGVPDVTYRVEADGRVFVFGKLEALVREYRQEGVPLDDLARSLVPKAIVSLKEAVETWHVIPQPYEVAGIDQGRFIILHRAFNARLPAFYATMQSVRAAFADILSGQPQHGAGDFVYRGQPMVLLETLEPSALPPRPAVESAGDVAHHCHAYLRGVGYRPGFEPVSESLFNAVKAMESAWVDDSDAALLTTQSGAPSIWARAATLGLESLNAANSKEPDEEDRENLTALRTLYPELSMLSDGPLYEWYDTYKSDHQGNRCWTADRDDDFLFFLLGNLQESTGVPQAQEHWPIDTHKAGERGPWVAYSLLTAHQDEPVQSAIAFGRRAVAYDRALTNLAFRVNDAMAFLARDTDDAVLQVVAFTTFMDLLLEGGRSLPSVLVSPPEPLSSPQPE